MPLGDKRLKSKMREMDTKERLSSGTSATSLPARSYGVTSVPTSARASLPAPSMQVELPSTFSRDIESVRRMTSTSRPRKSASTELARTAAPTASPRGPQVSMPMRSPSPKMSSMYTSMPEKNLGVRRSAAPIVISAPAPSRSSTPARSARSAQSTPARPTSTAKPAPRRQAPSVSGMSSSTKKKQDEQMSAMRARVEQGRNTDFAGLGASMYSGFSRR